jgi:hypothetical protein
MTCLCGVSFVSSCLSSVLESRKRETEDEVDSEMLTSCSDRDQASSSASAQSS